MVDPRVSQIGEGIAVEEFGVGGSGEGIDVLGPVHVIQFDAHLDWSRGVGKQRYTNGTPMRHMSVMKHVTGMTQRHSRPWQQHQGRL